MNLNNKKTIGTTTTTVNSLTEKLRHTHISDNIEMNNSNATTTTTTTTTTTAGNSIPETGFLHNNCINKYNIDSPVTITPSPTSASSTTAPTSHRFIFPNSIPTSPSKYNEKPPFSLSISSSPKYNASGSNLFNHYTPLNSNASGANTASAPLFDYPSTPLNTTNTPLTNSSTLFNFYTSNNNVNKPSQTSTTTNSTDTSKTQPTALRKKYGGYSGTQTPTTTTTTSSPTPSLFTSPLTFNLSGTPSTPTTTTTTNKNNNNNNNNNYNGNTGKLNFNSATTSSGGFGGSGPVSTNRIPLSVEPTPTFKPTTVPPPPPVYTPTTPYKAVEVPRTQERIDELLGEKLKTLAIDEFDPDYQTIKDLLREEIQENLRDILENQTAFLNNLDYYGYEDDDYDDDLTYERLVELEDVKVGVSEEQKKHIKEYRFDRIRVSQNSDCQRCTICLEDFENKQLVKELLECNHFFHSQCIDPWLLVNKYCPMCRREV